MSNLEIAKKIYGNTGEYKHAHYVGIAVIHLSVFRLYCYYPALACASTEIVIGASVHIYVGR